MAEDDDESNAAFSRPQQNSAPSPGPASTRTQPRRACDNCKRRKVKCDSTSPQCSNCRLSGLRCSYTAPMRKRGPKFRTAPVHRSDEQPNPEFSQSPTLQGNSDIADNSSHNIPTPEVPLIEDNDIVSDRQHWSPQSIQYQALLPRSTFGHHGVYEDLVSALCTVVPAQSISVMVTDCINLFIHFLFPIMPIVHEVTLRNSVSLFQSPDSHNQRTIDSGQLFLDANDLSLGRQFALVTAVCAETSFVLPLALFPKGPLVGQHFLRASRRMLHLYHDMDIESPDSSSLVIRYLHSNCTHAAGQTRISWHLLGEAIRLSQEMCLFDENALDTMDTIEAQLLRNIFWQLYTGDKSAALLNNRPFTLHEFNLRKEITLEHESPNGHSLLETSENDEGERFEDCLMSSFHLCQKQWSIASNLLLDLQLWQPVSAVGQTVLSPTEEQKSGIMDAYIRFLSLKDEMPTWLQQLEHLPIVTNEVEDYRRPGLWIQRTNLEVTFHSLRLIIVQKFIDLNLYSLVGVSSEPKMVALKKLEIARDMLSTIQKAPFDSLQVNGESCVEKIRQIGATLLEITQTIENQQILTRAQSTFSSLLDILASLDSQASNSLNIGT